IEEMFENMNESYENYLKTIYFISIRKKGGWVSNTEISDFLKVKPSSVTNMLYKLRELKLINWVPRKSLRLTSKGRFIAQEIIANYNCLRKFFIKILNLKDDSRLKQMCCEIEHHITPEVTSALNNLSLDNF
ncbi:MAG: metal-dependent transcriptional regulator, partial [Promethearchaeota archaeon]